MGFRDLSLDERRQVVDQGTEHFLRHGGGLSDEELSMPSLLENWTRRHLIGHLGYNAVGMCRLLDGAATGSRQDMYASAEQREREIEESVDLDRASLYRLVETETARLSKAWDELPPAAWSATVRTPQGAQVPASETLWMRSREVWLHAVDLATGATFADIPQVVLQTLLDDVVAAWRTSGVGAATDDAQADEMSLQVDDSSTAGGPYRLQGSLASVVQWMTGRGSAELTSTVEVPPPPRWL